MLRKLACSAFLGAIALSLPSSGRTAQAAGGTTIKMATLVPRGSGTERDFQKINKLVRNATGGKWKIKLFPSGVAGDEKDVIRKMRVGQLDASIVTTTGLSQIVREVAVLDAPGVINSYKELDRVKTGLRQEWQQTFRKQGMELLGWGEAGQYRYFSKRPIQRISDLKKMRPWLWPSSQVLKEIFRAVGATGVPLGVPEVYGALQTGMVDAAINTSVGASGLQWWSKAKHVTAQTAGVMLMGVVITDKRWKGIPPDVQEILRKEVHRATEKNIAPTRKDDLLTYKRLVKLGLKPTKWDAAAVKEYETMAATVRGRLTGRIYPKELLDRVVATARGQ